MGGWAQSGKRKLSAFSVQLSAAHRRPATGYRSLPYRLPPIAYRIPAATIGLTFEL